MLAQNKSEAELKELWVTLGGDNYEPGDDGMTYKQWFERIRDILTES